MLERHFDAYVRVHEERFEERHGALRAVVGRSVNQYLECGRLIGGFARIRCPSCHDEHLLAFSCRTRNLCSSCQAKRSVIFAERLRTEIVAPVAHRHVVFTIPKALRPLFERERSLLGLLARTAYETLRRVLKAAADGQAGRDAVPGVVASIQTFGSYANFHPHIHALVTEGTFERDGTFHAVAWPPAGVLEEAFRRLLLVALVRVERLSEEFAASLISWRHSGFSVHASSRVEALDLGGLERLGRYVTRPALAAGAVTIREDGQVMVATPPDPQTGSTSVELDPLAFVHVVVTQIPDARRHMVRYSGAYSARFRGRLRAAKGEAGESAATGAAAVSTAPEPVRATEPGSPEAKRRSAWARVLQKVFEVDPLLCPKCGTRMTVVAWITDPVVIERMVTHRKKAGLESPFDARGPPTSAVSE